MNQAISLCKPLMLNQQMFIQCFNVFILVLSLRWKWTVLVVDEGHRLKNQNSLLHKTLTKVLNGTYLCSSSHFHLISRLLAS